MESGGRIRLRRGVGTLLAALVALVGTVAAAPAGGASDAVAGVASLSSDGWAMTTTDGTVVPGGGAEFLGDLTGLPLKMAVTGISGTPSGMGYWLVAADGGIFSFGDAVFHGSTGALTLNQPIVGMAPTPTGLGYWLVAADGGIFSFGDAVFHGSTGALTLNQPIVGMAPTPTGLGYWLVAADGGIFSFGDAVFHGSTGALSVAAPIVGMATSPGGNGYWLAAQDGSVYAFGDASHFGDPAGQTFGPTVGVVRRAHGSGYIVVDIGGHHVYGPGLEEHHSASGTAELAPQLIAADVIERVNDERWARGLAPLVQSPGLSVEASASASVMADLGLLVHRDDLSSIASTHGATAAAENVGMTADSHASARLNELWMNAPIHRANMLNPGFDTIGVGVVCRDGEAYASMLLLRVGDPGPLTSEIPPALPFARSDRDPNSILGCS